MFIEGTCIYVYIFNTVIVRSDRFVDFKLVVRGDITVWFLLLCVLVEFTAFFVTVLSS